METTTIGSLISLQRGYDLTESQRRPGKVPIVGSAGVHGYHDKARAKGPGITIGRSGASFGRVTYVNEDYWPHNTTIFVTDFKGNEPLFVRYLLESLDFSSLNSGSAQQSLNRNYVYMVPVKHVPLPIQLRIASILSAYDDLIENSQRRIKILEEMARRLYREWFVYFRLPGHEGCRFVESPLGEIPEGWEVKKLTDCVEINPRVRVPREGVKPFVPMGCLSNDSMLITDIESREGNSGSKFQNNDTLFARITPCLENGKTGYVQFLPDWDSVAFGSTEFIILRSKALTPEFVYLLARSDEFRGTAIKSMSGATGRQRVQERCFDDYLMIQPPQDLLDSFSAVVRPGFDMVYKLHLQIQNLRRTRDLLLPRLLSGQIDVETLPELELTAS